MIDTFGAHSGDDDPITTVRVLRHIFVGVTAIVTIVAVCLLAAGLALDSIQLWNLGCTMLIGAFVSSVVVAAAYFSELGQRSIARTREDVHNNGERIDALEDGTRVLADTVQPDELERRRREG